MNQASAYEWVAEALRDCQDGVVFTGAGISTDSGIPDFRSPTGIWTKYKPVYFQEFMQSADARLEYWRQKAEGHSQFSGAVPSAGHRVVAKWQSAGRLRGVVTQNIDGLHQLAGSRDVLELHGNVRQVQCLDCEGRFDAGPLVGPARAGRTSHAPCDRRGASGSRRPAAGPTWRRWRIPSAPALVGADGGRARANGRAFPNLARNWATANLLQSRRSPPLGSRPYAGVFRCHWG